MQKIQNQVDNFDKNNKEKVNKILKKNKNHITHEIINYIDSMTNNNEQGQKELLNFLKEKLIIDKKNASLLDGLIFTKLKKQKTKKINIELNQLFPNGIVQFANSLKIDYQPLQTLLLNQNFQDADKLTQQYLCQLTQLEQEKQRKWLYFTDIQLIPSEDLLTLDLLWQIYSYGKFGFSIQRKIWLTNNYNWDIFLNKIGWVQNEINKRYPQEFTWTIEAPKGHLPLFNQLRGIQVLSYLFKHIAWK
uniref:GUN4-like domain-containing protein n=1 Tax=Thuretia quercifolia TaxID=189650 RepID=A0A1Z1MKC4_9FLOR|nr:hypothetical protein [Thuretia quercifolia]ARW66329.1 hypothetical protein [Thuretia quercifolia]